MHSVTLCPDCNKYFQNPVGFPRCLPCTKIKRDWTRTKSDEALTVQIEAFDELYRYKVKKELTQDSIEAKKRKDLTAQNKKLRDQAVTYRDKVKKLEKQLEMSRSSLRKMRRDLEQATAEASRARLELMLKPKGQRILLRFDDYAKDKVKKLLRLCHPDLHTTGRSELAKEITDWLIKLRKKS